MKITKITKITTDTPTKFYDVIDAKPYHNFIIPTSTSGIISHNCFASFFDEISFIPTQDIEKQKARAIDMIDTAVGGMKTRFTDRGKNPGIVILASSKRSEKSFLEEHMKKKSLSEGDNTLIVDEAVWDIKPQGTYSSKKFHVAVGNRFLTSEVIDDNVTDLTPFRDKGYRIIDVPVDLRPDFIDDIDRALCDYAGISSSDLSTYISGVRLSECKDPSLYNPFYKDVIEVGNAPTDKAQYYDFFDLSKIPSNMKTRPLFIHLDMSISGDKTGIGGVWIKGKRPPTEGQPASKDLVFQAAFNVSVKAPKGYQVSFEKNRNFIRWLREQGFNIRLVTSDTFQSYDLQQQLKAEHFNTDILSVDKVNSDRICVPYQHFKSVIYEKRFIIYSKGDLLTNEIVSLERNNNTGKIDHPDNGSKDAADAICGATYDASLFAEEYAFEFGDDLESIVNAEKGSDPFTAEQITVDFENELKSVFTGLPKNTSEEAKNIDFGFGPSVPLSTGFISDGIMVW